MAPNSILGYVYPIEGNEAAIGLDLMADPDRRALLEPAIISGETVVQGPVELVQGGRGLVVRKPIYLADGSFWGFSAAVLDWPSVWNEAVSVPRKSSTIFGLKRFGESDVIEGSPDAFTGEPATAVFGTAPMRWVLAMRPADGWPVNTPTTLTIWITGFLIALLGGASVQQLLRKSEVVQVERQKIAGELAHSEQSYQAVFQNAGVGIVVFDRRGRVLSANPAFRKIVNASTDEEVIGMSIGGFVHPDAASDFAGRMSMLTDTGGVAEWDLHVGSLGQEQWCHAATTAVVRPGGASPRFVVVVQDVTSSKTAELALAESESRYRQLFQSAPIAIQRQDFSAVKAKLDELRALGVTDLEPLLRKDTDLLVELVGSIRVTDANPAALALYDVLSPGADTVELAGLFTTDAKDSFVATIMAIWDTRKFVKISVSPQAADGSQLHLDLRWQPVTIDGHFDYSKVMVTISDVTELTTAQKLLEELLASKDRFLASVAHELRTPLTAVVGFAQELRDNAALTPEDRKEFTALVAQNSLEVAHLIEDILVITRAGIGEVRVVPEVVDLAAQVDATLGSLPGRTPSFERPVEAVSAYADPSRIRQIVRNLVTNASRYGGPNVRVEVYGTIGRAMVDVSDDGAAMSMADMKRIFELYQRTDHSVLQPGSIGLGLTVSQALARAQNGDVSVFRAGDRNVFRLDLPKTG